MPPFFTQIVLVVFLFGTCSSMTSLSSFKNLNENCNRCSNCKPLRVIGRVLDPTSNCQRPLASAEVEVTLEESASQAKCTGVFTLDKEGYLRTRIPNLSTIQRNNDSPSKERYISVCARGIGCSRRLFVLGEHSGESSDSTAERVANGTDDDFYALTTTWCLEPKRQQPSPSGQTTGKQSVFRLSSNIPRKVSRLVNQNGGASSRSWEDVGLDWIKRSRRSVAGGECGEFRGNRRPISSPGFRYTIPHNDAPDGGSLLPTSVPEMLLNSGAHVVFAGKATNANDRESLQKSIPEILKTIIPTNGGLADEFESNRNKAKGDKRDWEDSGMAWIKRNNNNELSDTSDGWDDSVMSWMKKRDGLKKRWDDAEMAWIKRDEKHLKVKQDQNNHPDVKLEVKREDKRDWENSGMAWIKRDDEKRNWDDSGMAWIKRSDENRDGNNNAKEYNVKDDDEKRNWDDSGMAWIKRKTTKKDWEDAGMAWIKRDDDKRSWDDGGMAWIKRDDDKRNWEDGGMAWIKRSN